MAKKGRRKLITTLILGGVLLYIVFAWFLPNFIGGLSFLNRFKSMPEQETPVSEKATLAPPVLNIPYEATNTATINIKGYSIPKTKIEIYIDDRLKSTTQTKNDGSFIAENVSLDLGNNNISGKTIDEQDSKSLSSKVIKIYYNNEQPVLNIDQPQDNQTISGDRKISVTGSVEPKENISVTINGSQVIVGNDGHFSQIINLNDGDNNITIIATSITGSSSQTTRKVIFQP